MAAHQWQAGDPLSRCNVAAARFGTVSATERQVALIAVHDNRVCGFLADAVIDTVDDMPPIDRALASPGVLGVATIAGRPVEIVDATHYIQIAGAKLPAAERSAA
jgi:hypothetical protein